MPHQSRFVRYENTVMTSTPPTGTGKDTAAARHAAVRVLYLAQVLGRPVDDAEDVRIGWVEDLVLGEPGLIPRVSAIVLGRRGLRPALVPWELVEDLGRRGPLRLVVPRGHLPPTSIPDDAVFLSRDILDKQIVDVNGRRVVRVNDLQLAPAEDGLRLVGADIGVRGLLRRLSLERPLRALARTVHADFPDRVIPWQYVEGLQADVTSVKLNVEYRRLRDLPPTDLADIMAQLDRPSRDDLVEQMDDATLAEALPHLEDDLQAEVITRMSEARASDIIEMLPPDEAADVLGDIAGAHAERILGLMEPDEAADVRELLQYEDDTAGGKMTTEYVSLAEGLTVDEGLVALREQAPDAETIYYLYVTDEAEHLRGVVSLRDLLTAAPGTTIASLTQRDVVTVHVDEDQQVAARVLTRYGLLALPVVDDEDVLRGIVTVDDVLDVMEEESDEDEARLAGAVDEGDELASVLEQAGSRLPWGLAVALAGAALATLLTGAPTTHHAVVAVALLALLLLPGVHLGGQAAALTQIALAEGDSLSEALRSHVRLLWPVGVGLAVVVVLVAAVSAWAFLGSAQVPVVAGWAAAVAVADLLAGASLPYVLHALRLDPALVSRPALAVLTLAAAVPLLLVVL
jgi:magnesium transporter